jgi:asparagine synthase (glutamine-hydrolysing)
MLSALEVRCPLVDKHVAEFANRLPLNFKIKSGKLKKVLFDLAAQQQLPESVLRHPKRGFTFPVAVWLQDMLKGFMGEILLDTDARLAQVFDFSFIQRLVAEHASGIDNHYRPLWNLIIFFSWMKNFAQLEF